MTNPPDSATFERRLNSWKEIASFFGKDQRTVKRWETLRGLPVRRVPGGTRTSVFAYVEELEAWLAGSAGATTVEPAAEAKPRRLAPGWLLAVAAVIVLVALLLAYAFRAPAPAFHPSAEAEAHYRSGVIEWNSRTEAGFLKASTEFGKAIELEPKYAAAYAGLANVYNLISQYVSSVPRADAYPKALAAAKMALELDPEQPEAYAALGFNAFYWQHEFAASAMYFEEALKRAPDSVQALHWAALTGMHLGDFARPLELIRRARQLSPDSRIIQANEALITYYAGQPDEAIALLDALKQAKPNFLATPAYLATIYLNLGRHEDFLREYEEAVTISGDVAQQAVAAAARRGLASGGGTGMLQAILDEEVAQHVAGKFPAFKIAEIAAMLGQTDKALDYLQKSVDSNESDALSLRIARAFTALHRDDGFRALLTQVGLPLPQ